MHVVVTGKRVKKGISLGLVLDNEVTEWFEKSIEKLDKCTNVEVEKCTIYFPNFFKITYFFCCFLIYQKMNVSVRDR